MKHLVSLMLLVILIAAGLSAQTVTAQQNVTWNSEFFNNPYLVGPAALTRQDRTIAFNWGAGSPGAGVPVDNFSARLAADVYFPAGTYRFYILADDGVHLYVGFQSYINTWDQPRPDQLLTVDIPLTAGTHHIQIDYLEVTNNAFIYVSWADLATNPTGPNFPAPVAPVVPGTGGLWTAQYFNNTSLTGSPSAVLNEASPTHNWGSSAPLLSILPDDFSVRWSSVQYLDGSSYQVSVRADDGVRVIIDGVVYINEWHGATGQLYTANLTLPAGNHTFVVEYFEAGGLAFLEFNLSRVTVVSPTPIPSNNTGATATVTTGMLNVRNAPNAVTGSILTRIRQGQTYSIVGRLADSSWWQINVNGVVGWVNGRYVAAVNTSSVPVVNAGTPTNPGNTQPTGYTLQTTGNLNIRSAPGTRYPIIGRIPMHGTAQIIARNSTNTWWKASYNGIVGWVSGGYIILPSNINYSAVPIE